ncbi:TIGR03619 family F420-dependent LLM class oxidoreductase [Nocardia shimofusensis]|uniref:TIGR03619 family F420-dependent LLM class oxidoreductase n=1 Tax=Nocardia shimofusensis TaxID=228596 RepID=UPI00082BD83F|nr:TIGR03619 family F420-dependent LLM class oxidoreductase [Nocardia shimofusensis]
MKLAVNLPNFGPQIDHDGIERWARTAEESGFDAVLLSDHLALTDDANRRSPAPFYECLSTLAWLAGRTTSVRLGAGVLIGSHRHPVHLARATATIDQLSGGRLVVGVGVGWAAEAFDVLGVPFGTRGARTDAVLATLRQAWTADVITLRGDHAEHRVHTRPRPLQRPHPPLWIGGNGAPALRRTNRFGTAWHPLHPSRERCRAGVAQLNEGKLFVPRVFFLPTPARVTAPGRPLGYGSLDQIADDLTFLTGLGADTVVLDTDPGNQALRRPLDDDLALIRLAGATFASSPSAL